MIHGIPIEELGMFQKEASPDAYTLEDFDNGVTVPESLEARVRQDIYEDGEMTAEMLGGKDILDFVAEFLGERDWRGAR